MGAEAGFSVPSSLFGNPDASAAQLIALANREGQQLSIARNALGGWQAMRKNFTFTLNPVGPYTGDTTLNSAVITNMSSVAGLAIGYAVVATGVLPASVITAIDTVALTVTLSVAATSTNVGGTVSFGQIAYPLPSDYRFLLPQTGWDANFRWQMLGPLNEQEWFTLQYGISPAGPRIRFKLEQNQVFVNPCPGTTQTDLIAFAYLSNAWCQSAAGAPQQFWGADTDTFLLDEDSFIMGLKWRILSAKGVPFTQEYKDYQRQVDQAKASDGASRSLPLNSSASSVRLLNASNVPDTGFGATS